MPFVPVPKDLTKVKTKLAFNLTKRQLLCFGGGALVGVPTYLLLRGSIGNDVAALLMVALMLPFFLFGIYEKDGQPFEKVLGHIIRAQFIYPKTRPYQTENFYAALQRQIQQEKEAARLEKSTAGQTGKTPGGRKKAARRRKGAVAWGDPAHAGRKTQRRR